MAEGCGGFALLWFAQHAGSFQWLIGGLLERGSGSHADLGTVEQAWKAFTACFGAAGPGKASPRARRSTSLGRSGALPPGQGDASKGCSLQQHKGKRVVEGSGWQPSELP